MLSAALPSLIFIIPLSCQLQSSLALSSYDRSDSYGVYYYNSYGEKRYSRCYDRYARPIDDCNPYGNGRYNSYDRYNRYDRYSGRTDNYNNYDRYGDRINLGRGQYRILPNGRDVEMTCEFPSGTHLISNIVWEKDNAGRSYYNSYRSNSLGHLGGRMTTRSYGSYGSILTIRDFDSSRDSGVYRCVGTRSYNGYSSYSGRRETVYMDVDFYPRDYDRDNYYGRGYDDYFNNRRYDYGYRRPYGYAYAKTSEDKAVVENDAKKNKEDN